MASRVRCGTPSGFRKHQADGEKPCPPCIAAKAEYDVRWRAADDNTIRNRLHAKAQGRAVQALKVKYADEYEALYYQAKDEVYKEAGMTPKHIKPRKRKKNG